MPVRPPRDARVATSEPSQHADLLPLHEGWRLTLPKPIRSHFGDTVFLYPALAANAMDQFGMYISSSKASFVTRYHLDEANYLGVRPLHDYDDIQIHRDWSRWVAKQARLPEVERLRNGYRRKMGDLGRVIIPAPLRAIFQPPPCAVWLVSDALEDGMQSVLIRPERPRVAMSFRERMQKAIDQGNYVCRLRRIFSEWARSLTDELSMPPFLARPPQGGRLALWRRENERTAIAAAEHDTKAEIELMDSALRIRGIEVLLAKLMMISSCVSADFGDLYVYILAQARFAVRDNRITPAEFNRIVNLNFQASVEAAEKLRASLW